MTISTFLQKGRSTLFPLLPSTNQEHNLFGYKLENVAFFPFSLLPCPTKVLLTRQYEI